MVMMMMMSMMMMMVTMTMIDDVSRVGKLKHRAGFLESLQGEENPVYKDQVGFFGDKNPVYKDQDGFLDFFGEYISINFFGIP